MVDSTHNVPWAIECFRPLLNQIDIDALPLAPATKTFYMSDTPRYIQLGMEYCVLTASQLKADYTANGFYVFFRKTYKGKDYFFINVYLNSRLYANNTPLLRISRTRSLHHEFTHCIAALLSLGKIKSKVLLEKLIKEVGRHAQIHSQFLLPDTSNPHNSVDMELEIYPDEHFHLGDYDCFDDSYVKLYKNLILDRVIFETYFTSEIQIEFNQFMRKKNIQEASTLLRSAMITVTEDRGISTAFINLRAREEFIDYYLKKSIKR